MFAVIDETKKTVNSVHATRDEAFSAMNGLTVERRPAHVLECADENEAKEHAETYVDLIAHP